MWTCCIPYSAQTAGMMSLTPQSPSSLHTSASLQTQCEGNMAFDSSPDNLIPVLTPIKFFSSTRQTCSAAGNPTCLPHEDIFFLLKCSYSIFLYLISTSIPYEMKCVHQNTKPIQSKCKKNCEFNRYC